MKKKLMILVLGCGLLYSCTQTPIISNNNVFVVNEIIATGDSLCIYRSIQDDNTGTQVTAIILPVGMFNVGDTIKPCNFKK